MDENDFLDALGLLKEDPWPDVDKKIDIEMTLDKMLPKYRDALILWGQGFPYAEIAEQLDIGKTTAYRYVQAGRKILEQAIS